MGCFGHDDHVHGDDHDHGHDDDDDKDDHKHDDDHGRKDHVDDDHAHDDHGHDHVYGRMDLHFWLDPANAVAMVDLIETRLTAAYPDQAQAFAGKRGSSETRLDCS